MTRTLIATLLVCFVFGNFILAASPPATRPRVWAQRIDVPGVPNLYRLTKNLYRRAQPTAEGMRNLQKMGIKTVIDLRSFHSDQDQVAGTSLRTKHIRMKAWHPEMEDVIKFLKIVSHPSNGPFLVHCQQGADRTGTMCAIYRIVVQGWTKKQALEEMTKGGYGFHTIWIDLPPWIKALDVEQIRRETGIKNPAY